METTRFDKTKSLFLDVVNAKDYVHLDKVSVLYDALKEAVEKPLKMILVYGRPGTGKSMMLNKLASELRQDHTVLLYQTPILDESAFLQTLARDLFGQEHNEALHLNRFIELLQAHPSDRVPIVLLDEAQLYSSAHMEKIRLLSDTRAIKFVVTLHKTEKEDLIAKEHFQTRIWESVELENATPSELKIYIQKKLMQGNFFDVANMFHDHHAGLIHSLTRGNYRETNKLLYTLFDIYAWYEIHQPTKIDYRVVTPKIIEMAAIHTGLIDA